MEQTVVQLHPLDFVIFAAMLLGSAAIGVYFAYKDRKTQNTQNYYFGNQEVSLVAVSISLAVSFISAVTVIGIPVEVYLYGTIYLWTLASKMVSAFFALVYYIPFIHRLQLKSVYEYLELRFNRSVRTLVSGITVIQMILYMSVTIYVPSLAVSAVTPLGLNWSIALTSIICTFYTAIGGIKAVIWTDVLQGGIMFVGSVSILIPTFLSVGGIEPMKEALERGGRMNFLNFNPDITMRSTMWTIMIGMAVNYCTAVCMSQVYAQRYLTCKSTKGARIAFGIQFIPVVFFTLVAVANGLVMYTYYEGCDPVMAKQIQRYDQTTPWLAVEILKFAPGMAGLFISASMSGTLSTVSSGINSVTALTIMDFMLPFWPNMKTKKRMLLSKLLSFLLGGLVMGMTYLISLIELNIVPITALVVGFAGGPVMGLFTVGIFMPWVNTKGAFGGLITGWAMASWVGFSAILIDDVGAKRVRLPLSTDTCNVNATTEYPSFGNITYIHNATESLMGFSGNSDYELGDLTSPPVLEVERPILYDTLYAISPFLYGTLGLLVCVAVANLISLITGINKTSESDPELFMPIAENRCLPESVRKFLRFGVPERKVKDTESDEDLKKNSLTSNPAMEPMISKEMSNGMADSTSLPTPPGSPNVSPS